MKRREFIVNSLLTVGGVAALNGCGIGASPAKRGKEGQVVTRKFQNLDVPLLSFGCMRLPTVDGTIDMPHFEKMVDYAMRHGVNYFDTAYMYHKGESELAVGKVLSAYKRESFFLASKNPLRALTSKEDVRRIFEEQLKKCQTDYFDFYLAHNISVLSVDNYRNFDVFEELMKFKQEGKVRHVGFSYHGADELLMEVAHEHPWEFCQIQLNYLDWKQYRQPDPDEASHYAPNIYKNYDILTNAKIPVLPMTPVRGGALAKLTGSAKAVLEDEAPNDTQASFALRWVAGRENNFTVLSGMSSLQQLEENVVTFTDYRPFTEKEEKIAQKIAEILQKHGEINCTTCNYCQDCPRGIAIPVIFDLYNDYKATGDKNAFLQKYDMIKDRHKADKCIKCGLCSAHCPQLLNIPPLLEMVDNTVKELKKGA
jgi:predicted aldo/keto reductase-like oxidoreductase